VGISGLLVAGILGAAMGSLSSALNSMSNSTVADFIHSFFRTVPSDDAMLRLARVMTLVWAVLMAVFALKQPFWVGIILGVCLVGIGVMGDLIESLIKRDMGIKDMSSVLPGHGGVMDRLDSLLVAAPVAWLIMYLLVPGG
jgi:CDP-diglyceride synthetase